MQKRKDNFFIELLIGELLKTNKKLTKGTILNIHIRVHIFTTFGFSIFFSIMIFWSLLVRWKYFRFCRESFPNPPLDC